LLRCAEAYVKESGSGSLSSLSKVIYIVLATTSLIWNFAHV